MTSAEAGSRLDRFLEAQLRGISRSQIKRLVERGLVHVDDAPVKAGHALRPGDRIRVEIPVPPPLELIPQDLDFTVVYEDEALLVVDKPAGLSVHPGAGRPDGTLVNGLLGRGIALSPLGGPFRPGIVHRLDRETSGLLVVAKQREAHLELARDLASRGVSRRYWALVWGRLLPEEGRISGALSRSRADRRRMRVVASGGKEAATRYRVLWAVPEWSVLSVSLETGRTHQIRAHCRHLGHPVFGDPEYGGRGSRLAGLGAGPRETAREALAGLSRQALHAARLAFRHPASGRVLAFTSELPEDIHTAAARLGVPPEARSLGAEEDS